MKATERQVRLLQLALACMVSLVPLVTAGWPTLLQVALVFLVVVLLMLGGGHILGYARRKWDWTERKEAEALRTENERLRTENAQLCAENEGATAEVRGLRKETLQLQSERKEYEEALQSVVDRSPRPLREIYEVTCFIGEDDDQDCIHEEWETVAVHDEKPVLWHRVSASAEGEGAPPKHAFRQLEDVEAYERFEGRTRRLRVLSLPRRGGRIWGLVNFDTAIKPGHPRLWGIRYRWRGMWNPLRTQGTDGYWLDLREGGVGVEWDAVVVRFVFPITARDPEVMAAGGPPGPSRDETTDEWGQRVLSFRLQNPQVQVYTFSLRVRGFDRSNTASRPVTRGAATPPRRSGRRRSRRDARSEGLGESRTERA